MTLRVETFQQEPISLDRRLQRRLSFVRERAATAPPASFPELFPKTKELAAAYRLLSNGSVQPAHMLKDHIAETVGRCEAAGDVLLLADTSEMEFGTPRRGDGPLDRWRRGFLCHVNLAVAGVHERRVLGVLNMECWTREELPETARSKQEKKRYDQARSSDPNKESLVWQRGVMASHCQLAGRARTISVQDSDADDYALVSAFQEMGLHHVTRSKHNRALGGDFDELKLNELMLNAPVQIERTVPISSRGQGPGNGKRPPPKRARTHPARRERTATLLVSCLNVEIKRTQNAPSDAPNTLSLNVVRVFEPHPPEGEAPVEWRLLTSLPIGTRAEVEYIVDVYCVRWVVEEFFKALKTGCSLEDRQLDSTQALVNATALFVPIATSLLDLRSLAEAKPDAPAEEAIPAEHVEVLKRLAINPLPTRPTAKDALYGIANLGGHIVNNGRPGWLVLMRGYIKLVAFIEAKRRYDSFRDV